MSSATSNFTEWLRATVTAAGFNLDERGGVRAFAEAAGTDPGQTSRALAGKTSRPSIEYLSTWTRTLRMRGSQVTMREMLIRAGWVTAEELPDEDTTLPSTKDVDLNAVAEALGVPDNRRALFIASVQSVAKTFAEAPQGGSVGSQSQTGGLSAKR